MTYRSPITRFIFLVLPLVALSLLSAQERISKSVGWESVPTILKRIVPPHFPNREFDVTTFGAVGDGLADCTQAFAEAIGKCNKAGGGRVVVPGGTYLTGAIHLKSGLFNFEKK